MRCLLQAIPGELSEERAAIWKTWLQDYREALKAQDLDEAERRKLQNSVNPCYIPRNHLLQEVINEAESGNYKAVWLLRLFKVTTKCNRQLAVLYLNFPSYAQEFAYYFL